jgi:hypothetical protein
MMVEKFIPPFEAVNRSNQQLMGQKIFEREKYRE